MLYRITYCDLDGMVFSDVKHFLGQLKMYNNNNLISLYFHKKIYNIGRGSWKFFWRTMNFVLGGS